MSLFQDFQFTVTDSQIIRNRLVRRYEEIRRANGEPGFRLSLADPEYSVLSTYAAGLTQAAADIDLTGKGNLIWFAGEDTLEFIGALYGERGRRLPAAPALTTIRYTLAVPRTVRTVIPKGFRVTPDNKVFFATSRAIEIPSGETYGNVEAECLTPGMAGMGWAVGEITGMVDLVPFVASAQNITETSGGADIEDLEAYRARLQLLPESFSVAGPDGAYEFWAKTASAAVMTARAWMPDLDLSAPPFLAFLNKYGITDPEGFYEDLFTYFRESGTGLGNVNVCVLLQDGALPSQEVKDQVYDTLSDKRVRPLTDFVHVVDPEPVEYSIKGQFWILTQDAAKVSSILENVHSAVERFVAWQKNALGRDINPSFLHQILMEQGIKWAVIEEPARTMLEPWQVGILSGDVEMVYSGLEDE